MITITPLENQQISAAKAVIAEVARRMFEPGMNSEQFAAMLEDEHELQDVDNFEQVYGGGRGLFLIASEDEQVIGTGAIRPLEAATAELKRLWLLQEYHGQGTGYRIVKQLLEFARKAGYKRVVLQTSNQAQRALVFYRQLGFTEIVPYYENPEADEIFMGRDLDV